MDLSLLLLRDCDTSPAYLGTGFVTLCFFNRLYCLFVWGNRSHCKDVCLFVFQGVGLWNLWSLLGLFEVLTLQSIRGAHSCSQGVILSEVIQIALCPLNG